MYLHNLNLYFIYMQVCKLDAGLNIIRLPFNGEADDLEKKKKTTNLKNQTPEGM